MPPPRSTGMPLPRRRNWRPACVPSGMRDLGAAAVAGGHFDAAAQRGRDEGHRRAAMEIMAVALEDRMLRRPTGRCRDRPAARRSIPPGLRPTGGCACLPRRRRGTSTASVRSFCTWPAPRQALQGLRMMRPGAAAVRAGAFDGEEALLRAHLAGAGAGRALLGLGARFRARAAAAFAGHGRVDARSARSCPRRLLPA